MSKGLANAVIFLMSLYIKEICLNLLLKKNLNGTSYQLALQQLAEESSINCSLLFARLQMHINTYVCCGIMCISFRFYFYSLTWLDYALFK